MNIATGFGWSLFELLLGLINLYTWIIIIRALLSWVNPDPRNQIVRILVLLTEPTFPGCQMEVRPLGTLRLHDKGERDEKILAVLLEDPLEEEYRKLSDVPGYLRREIEQFFRTYKDLEGKQVRVLGWKGRPEAHSAITQCIKRYKKEYPAR